MDATILLLCGSVACGGGLSHTRIQPPPEYDRPFMGQLTITNAISKADVRMRCNTPKDPHGLGCAWARGYTCEIILAPTKDIEAAGVTREIAIRHETGHCNGWSAKHEGAVAIDWPRYHPKHPTVEQAAVKPPTKSELNIVVFIDAIDEWERTPEGRQALYAEGLRLLRGQSR